MPDVFRGAFPGVVPFDEDFAPVVPLLAPAALDPFDADAFVPFAPDRGRVDEGAPTEPFAVVVGRAEPFRAPEGRDAGRRAEGEVGRRAGTPRFCRSAPPGPGTVVGAPARRTTHDREVVPFPPR